MDDIKKQDISDRILDVRNGIVQAELSLKWIRRDLSSLEDLLK